MGQYFEMDDEDKQEAIGNFDDMLTEWGKPCKLNYLSTEVACPNCLINPRNNESTNVYKAGGPEPFENGEICPVCDGRGHIKGSATADIITMVIDWLPKPWMNVGSGSGSEGDRLLRVPGGMVTTRGWTKDLPKILRADIVYLDITNPYLTNRFKLYGQPYILGAITNNKYFIAVWEAA